MKVHEKILAVAGYSLSFVLLSTAVNAIADHIPEHPAPRGTTTTPAFQIAEAPDPSAMIRWNEVPGATAYRLHLFCSIPGLGKGDFHSQLPESVLTRADGVVSASFPGTEPQFCEHRISAVTTSGDQSPSAPLDITGATVGMVPDRTASPYDISCDGKVTITDVLAFLQRVVRGEVDKVGCE